MSELLKPPAVPSAILNFFAGQPDFPALAGDITEEFHQRAQSSGGMAAKRWYWREAFRNALALTWRELGRTPVRVTLVAFGCYLAVNFVPAPLILSFNMRWSALLALNFAAVLAVGWIGAKLLPGREWALDLTYTVMTVCLTLPVLWYSFTFVFKHPLPLHSWAAVIGGGALRLTIFWLGGLWIRVHSRSFAASSTASSIPRSSPPRNPPDLS